MDVSRLVVKRRILAVAVALATFCLGKPSWANSGVAETYYVAPWGSASNAGTSVTAPTTLASANTKVDGPGDTVFLLSGVYTSTSAQSNHIKPGASGSSSAPIIYAAVSGEVPTIRLDSTAPVVSEVGETMCMELLDRSYITVQGITCEGADGFANINDFHVDVGAYLRRSQHIVLQNNLFRYIKYAGIVIDKKGSGSTDTAYNVVQGNRIEYIGCNPATTTNCTIPVTAGTASDGIVINGAYSNYITANFLGHVAHDAITLKSDTDATTATSYNLISTNTLQNAWHTAINIREDSADSGRATRYNVIGGNFVVMPNTDPTGGYAYNSPDGISLHAPENIIRFNKVIAPAGSGLYLSPGICTSCPSGGSWANCTCQWPRLYKNKFYGNTVASGMFAGISLTRSYGVGTPETDYSANSFVNNMVLDNTATNVTLPTEYTAGASTQVFFAMNDRYGAQNLQGSEFRNNLISDTTATSTEDVFSIPGLSSCKKVDDLEAGGSCSVSGSFVGNVPSSANAYVFAKDHGDYLTHAVSCSTNTVVVTDGHFFSKGIASLSIPGDEIQIYGDSTTRKIVDITFGSPNDTLTLDGSPSGSCSGYVTLKFLDAKPDIGGPN